MVKRQIISISHINPSQSSSIVPYPGTGFYKYNKFPSINITVKLIYDLPTAGIEEVAISIEILTS